AYRGRLLTEGRGLPSELDVELETLTPADDLENHPVPGFLRGHEVAQPLDRAKRDAVGPDDHVAAERVALAGEHDVRRPGPDAGLGGSAAGLDAVHQEAFRDGQPEDPRELRRDAARADPDIGVLDLAVPDDLGDDGLHRVARDREADPNVAFRR